MSVEGRLGVRSVEGAVPTVLMRPSWHMVVILFAPKNLRSLDSQTPQECKWNNPHCHLTDLRKCLRKFGRSQIFG